MWILLVDTNAVPQKLSRSLHVRAYNMSIPYSTYYKPMGDLPYSSSEQGGVGL